jgi:CheY-like chemotaxis protein
VLFGGVVSTRYANNENREEKPRITDYVARNTRNSLEKTPRRHVLIVEDHTDTRDALKLLLELQGYEVRAAQDGLEALSMIEERLPDVVITDYDMPRLDGAGLARELRARATRIGHVPILVLTALGQGLVKEAMDAGADAYIAKPVDFHTLETTIEMVVPRR